MKSARPNARTSIDRHTEGRVAEPFRHLERRSGVSVFVLVAIVASVDRRFTGPIVAWFKWWPRLAAAQCTRRNEVKVNVSERSHVVRSLPARRSDSFAIAIIAVVSAREPEPRFSKCTRTSESDWVNPPLEERIAEGCTGELEDRLVLSDGSAP